MPTAEHISRLIEARQVAFVLGAGVTVNATGRRDLGWIGLIERGLSRLEAFRAPKPAAWFSLVRSELELAAETQDAQLLISAAEKLTAALGGQKSADFRQWLKGEFEDLVVEDSRLIEALGATALPILTTNYDTLVEGVLARAGVSWHEPGQLELAISGRSLAVGHLHGVWSHPESVVFGGEKYGEIIAEESAQHLQRVLTSTRSLVFVGCGSTVDDPNLGGLFEWIDDVMRDSDIEHYWLCREGEAAARSDIGTRIKCVSYGAEYDDLLPFVTKLTEAANNAGADPTMIQVRLDTAGRAAERVLEQVRAETVLAEHLDNVDTASFEDLVVPPVLLPVPYEQYVKSQDLSRDKRIKRCQLKSEVGQDKRMLLVSDEKVGLSTALKWLVYESYRSTPDLVPIVIDFRALKPGHEPLLKHIRRELKAIGFTDADELPPIALAIDNVLDKPEKIFERVLKDLANPAIKSVFLGTRTGAESAIVGHWSDGTPALRYLGRLNGSDIRSLAALVAPDVRARRMASKAIGIINQEHLPRTPITICLLISALLQGQQFLATSSETALLDGYLTLLLGGGDPHDDARWSLDAYERTELLSTLAAEFCKSDSGSMSEDQVVTVLSSYFDSVGWSESPLGVLQNLQARRVVRVIDNKVGFAQASYLHLFAAKAAIHDKDLRERLFVRPLYYAAIIRHYAALNRGDAECLRRVAEILRPPEVEVGAGSFFGPAFEVGDKVLDSESVEDLVEHLSLSNLRGGEGDTAGEDASSDAEGSPPGDGVEYDILDTRMDDDVDPFPAERMEDTPPIATVMNALTLVSNVLRDSETVKDLELKQSVLERTLLVWGKLVTLLETNDDFLDFMEAVARRMVESLELSEDKTEVFVKSLRESAPVLVGLGGMSKTLATRKLIRILDKVFQSESFVNDAHSSVMGSFLSFGLSGSRWIDHFLRVQAVHPELRSVDGIMLGMAVTAYYFQRLSEQELADLEKFIVAQHLSRYAVPDARARKRAAGQIIQKLQLERRLHARERLPLGVSILQGREAELPAAEGSD